MAVQIKCVMVTPSKEIGYTRDINEQSFMDAYGAKYGPIVDTSTTPPTERPRTPEEVAKCWSEEMITMTKDYCHRYKQLKAAQDAAAAVPPD